MNAPTKLAPVILVTTSALLAACSVMGPAGPRPTSSPTPRFAPPTVPPPTATSPSPSESPTPAPTATPRGAVEVTSPAQAAALVFAANPLFASVRPLMPNAVGQSAWYEALPTLRAGVPYTVNVTLGSGDCPAGCITKHTWTYTVSRDGEIELVAETGPQVEATPNPGTADPASVRVTLLAGPVCPVERESPDPSCAARPVPDAVVVLRDPTGSEVARALSDAKGQIEFSVPAGAYYIEPQPVEGFLVTPEAQAFSVVGGDNVGLRLDYDTGIR